MSASTSGVSAMTGVFLVMVVVLTPKSQNIDQSAVINQS
jgi:hypothetical protein